MNQEQKEILDILLGGILVVIICVAALFAPYIFG
jgi:hypothetical protein